MDHLKQVYLTKLTDDARKTSAICGQNRNTRLHLTREKSIYDITRRYTWISFLVIFYNTVQEFKTNHQIEMNHSGRRNSIFFSPEKVWKFVLWPTIYYHHIGFEKSVPTFNTPCISFVI